MTQLNLKAVEQVTDDALIDEVNRRLKAGLIEADALEIPEVEPETGGGTKVVADKFAHLDSECLVEAAARFARRDYPETLWNLEKALGRQFSGLGDLVLGRH